MDSLVAALSYAWDVPPGPAIIPLGVALLLAAKGVQSGALRIASVRRRGRR